MKSNITVDIGNEFCVAAQSSENGVDILQNESSERLIPSVIGFTGRRLHFGRVAKDYQFQNIEGTVTNIKTLIGLKYNSDRRKELQKSVPFKLIDIENGFTGVLVPFDDGSIFLRPCQLVAFLIKNLIKNKIPETTSVTFITEPWWGDAERKVILAGAEIVGLKVLKMVNSTTSSAVKFYHEHPKFIPKEKSETITICFVDFGDSSLSITNVEMSQGHINVINHTFEENLGGRNFTLMFADYLCEKCKEKYKVDPRSSDKTFQRFLKEVARLKCALSINQTMKFEVQSVSGVDISMIVQRSDFEEAVSSLLYTLETVARESKKVCGKVAFIEAYGGTSRLPCVKNILQSVYGCEVRQSLNADECVVAGAAHLSQTHDLEVRDISCFPIFITYKMPNEKVVNEILFEADTAFGTKKSITVTAVGRITVYGNNGDILDLAMKNKETTKIKLTFLLNHMGIIEIVQAVDVVSGKPVEYEKCIPELLTAEQVAVYRVMMQEIELRNEEGMHAENLRGELEVALMNSTNEDVKCWFEKNEFELLSSSEYQDALDKLNGKRNSTKRGELRKKVSKVMEKVFAVEDEDNRTLLIQLVKKTEQLID